MSSSPSATTAPTEQGYYTELYSARSQADQEADVPGYVRGEKRRDYWSWEQFYMSVAFLSSRRSGDPKTKVGACIVNPDSKKIVGIGHNALPESREWDQNDFPHWDKRDIEEHGFENTKYAHVCHAAINAILNKNAENLKDCVLYTTHFPAHEDAKMIIQARIKEVVYFQDKYPDYTFTLIAKKLFKKAGVSCKSYSGTLHPDPETLQANIPLYPLPSTSVGRTAEDSTFSDSNLDPDTGHLPKSKDFFMVMACLAARRSKDPTRQVGACIVNTDEKIVGIGYNGFPLRVSDDDPDMTWGKEGDDPSKVKYPYVVHAEVNAIMHKTCIDLKGCTLYTTLFPCNECAKVIIQCGIEKIYYLSDDHHDKVYTVASRQLLERAGYNLNTNSGAHTKICWQYTPPSKCDLPDLRIDVSSSHTTSTSNCTIL